MNGVMDKIESTRGKIDEQYDMEKEDFEVIIQNSSSTYDLVYNGFRLGYVQGMKSTK